jgi:hypothetical protein
MPQVYPAEPYRAGALHSLGRASYMLMRQFKFPHTFREDEQLISTYSDRIDDAKLRTVLHRHAGSYDDLRLENWFRTATHGRIQELLKELLEADLSTTWTGYRVTGSVAGNGHTVWYFELFSRRPESHTAIYTNELSPNVLPGPRH